MRRASIFALFIALVSAAFAQTTTVTGTVTDPDSTNWANGNITFNLIGSGGPPYYCNNVRMSNTDTTVLAALDSGGNFSASLCSNSSITPVNSQWQLRVCSATSAPCQNLSAATTVSGASQSLTTFINNQLTAIRISSANFNTRAYTDAEIPAPILGFSYFNINSSLPRFWNGSVWANTGAGSTVGVTSFKTRTGAVVPVAGDYTAAQVTNALDLSATADQSMNSNLIIAIGKSLGTNIIRDQAGNSAATLASGRFTFPNLSIFSGGFTNPVSNALTSSAALFSGTPVSGGTGTTTTPLVLITPTATALSTSWQTGGTYLGINAASGFTGDLFSFQTNGGTQLHLSAGGTLTGGASNFANYQTSANCANTASPAVCGSASGGSVAVPAGTNPTLQVNTTRLLATSQVYLFPDQSLGTRLSVTCNTTVPTSTVITARSAGASFTFQANGTFTTNPVCYDFLIFN